jgi:hypothetical protein
MMNVDSSALGIRIDHRHAREKRANEKNRACSERTHLLEHCSARKIAQGKLGTWPERNWGNRSAVIRIGH